MQLKSNALLFIDIVNDAQHRYVPNGSGCLQLPKSLHLFQALIFCQSFARLVLDVCLNCCNHN